MGELRLVAWLSTVTAGGRRRFVDGVGGRSGCGGVVRHDRCREVGGRARAGPTTVRPTTGLVVGRGSFGRRRGWGAAEGDSRAWATRSEQGAGASLGLPRHTWGPAVRRRCLATASSAGLVGREAASSGAADGRSRAAPIARACARASWGSRGHWRLGGAASKVRTSCRRRHRRRRRRRPCAVHRSDRPAQPTPRARAWGSWCCWRSGCAS